MNSDIDFDDDGPPMLVAADQPDDTENLSAEVDDMSLTRVPITIITGMQHAALVFEARTKPMSCRLSGCWQNYSHELHLERTSWKEDCCHSERYVSIHIFRSFTTKALTV